MAFSISTGNIWVPGATDLTSTDGNGKLFDDDKLPKPDLETSQKEITKLDSSPGLYAENVHDNQGRAGVSDNLSFGNFRFGDYLTQKFGDVSLGRKVISPDEGKRLDRIG